MIVCVINLSLVILKGNQMVCSCASDSDVKTSRLLSLQHNYKDICTCRIDNFIIFSSIPSQYSKTRWRMILCLWWQCAHAWVMFVLWGSSLFFCLRLSLCSIENQAYVVLKYSYLIWCPFLCNVLFIFSLGSWSSKCDGTWWKPCAGKQVCT